MWLSTEVPTGLLPGTQQVPPAPVRSMLLDKALTRLDCAGVDNPVHSRSSYTLLASVSSV